MVPVQHLAAAWQAFALLSIDVVSPSTPAAIGRLYASDSPLGLLFPLPEDNGCVWWGEQFQTSDCITIGERMEENKSYFLYTQPLQKHLRSQEGAQMWDFSKLSYAFPIAPSPNSMCPFRQASGGKCLHVLACETWCAKSRGIT